MSRDELIKLLKREFATTLKVIRAFLEGMLSFKPHPRSSPAVTVMSTFVFEMYLIGANVFGDNLDRSIFKTYSPANVAMLADDFEKAYSKVLADMEKMADSDLKKPVEFAGNKSTAGEFIQFMLFDQIHHRGQMSVYIRLAGGKVPSVYGPSADDTGTNL